MNNTTSNPNRWPISLQRAVGEAQQAMNGYLSASSDAPGRVAAIVRNWRAALAKIEGDGYASTTAKAEAQSLLTDSTRAALDDLQSQFGQRLTDLRTKLADPAPPIPADEAMRLWARAERQLSAGVPLADVLSTADMATVRVIADELPSWHRAKNPADLRGADALTEADLRTIAARRYELADPQEQRRLDLVAKASKGATFTEAALSYARYEIENPTGAVTLPTWDGDSVTV